MWETIYSILLGIPNRIWRTRVTGARRVLAHNSSSELSRRTPVVALIVSDQDRQVSVDALNQQLLDIHLAKTYEEMWDGTKRLNAPVVILDRDWPDVDWRAVVQSLALLPQRPCVILMSAVADEYLWHEVVRYGGYDSVTKPLRTEEVVRVVKLALSYWKIGPSEVAY